MTLNSSFTTYVSCLDGCSIEVFASDATTGSLQHIQSVTLGGKGLPLAVSPDKRRLYASVIGERNGKEENRIETFEIGLDGQLLALSTTVVMARMAHISVDRTGQFLLGASFPSSLIAVYPIGDAGHVQSVPSFSMAASQKAHQILIDPSNRFAFVPNLGADLVMQLVFDQETGKFIENNPSTVALQTGAGCRHIAFHPNRRYVYLLNELDGSLVVYQLNPDNGTLSELSRDSILKEGLRGTPWGAQLHVTPDGASLFASERRGSTLAFWDIDEQSGQLHNRRIIETGKNPRCFDITPSGKFLVLAALDDNEVAVYDISERNAAPELLQKFPTATAPCWVEIV